MAIGSGVLLPGVAENPTFPILSALAYTTGLGYRPTCDIYSLTSEQQSRTVQTAAMGQMPRSTERILVAL